MNILDRSNSPTLPAHSAGSDGRLGQASLDALASWTHLIVDASSSKTLLLPALSTPLQSLLLLSRSAVLHFREMFEILSSIHRLKGRRRLFKGLGPSLTGVVPATVIKFYTYGNCKLLSPGVLQCSK
ncbi:hypothetical protein PAAG_11157 [Paracoccidioides lutzii Pb01]|uniref:Uncharacterized protein n=1 Tax=Paracoccidioides lutzii (strain ATCC MYA-826 / Pb01) TaxID=502779 RepID=A0A0A2VM95_PARBA|nr:hypothetical protein PAAG_11157 [Paracoccidioides lutzii Pb01]KGQ01984.1 hypothetical protein PAAG_11157 [Paracoccidioides lutzii Pb01]